jgi:predicted phosphodiesterase
MTAVRLALLSDIHGNLTALSAVLEDIEAQGGVDKYLILGDMVAIGPEPVPVLERLHQLPNVQFVRGNTDRYLVTGERPPPTIAESEKDARLLPILVDVAHTFAWTQGVVTQGGWLSWLQELPFEIRLTLPDGTRLLGIHGAPGADDIPIYPTLSDQEITTHLTDCEADLICMGHTHTAMNRQVGDWHVVNLGSISNPKGDDWRASYVYLTADSTGYEVQHRRVAYDYQAVLDILEALHHPSRAFITSLFNKNP